ncbi:MAG: MFS transporter [Bacteroidales bacterium]|jgi:MFS family permease|nr:peptide MFS transporter [Bacteroidales bacterium]
MINTLHKEQKSGILLLLGSKTFESLAFFLLMAIFFPFLNESLGIDSSKVGFYYTLFYGTIGITSFISGFLGDKRNRFHVVTIGFLLLTVMHLAIAFLPGNNFLILATLILLGLGKGLISPNMVVFLGNIYNEKENKIIGLSGFILFSFAVSTGAVIAPLLSAFLKNNWGFYSLFAFIFALLSFILFLKFKNHYNKLNIVADRKDYVENTDIKKLNTLILFSILTIGIFINFVLYQNRLTFTHAIHDFFENGFEITQVFNNIDNYISFIILALFAFLILKIKRLNWSKIFNVILIGLIVAIIAFIVIATSLSISQAINSLFIQSYIFILIAETLISPIIFYITYRCSPLKHKGLFQGISFIFRGIANQLLFLGLLMYNKNALMAFIGFAIILTISAILILILKKKVNNKLTEIERNIEADNIQ